MVEGIRAVAFDVDGTMYPTHKFYFRVWPYYLKNFKFFFYFSKVRKELHRKAKENPCLAGQNFYDDQAALLAQKMKISKEAAGQLIEKICYKGLLKYYVSLPTYPDLLDLMYEIKARGFKVAILSDFPLEQKGNLWGVSDICDVLLGAENCGALKPSKVPFEVLADQLGLEPWQVLYVGNSKKYDVEGAKNAGMKSALKLKGFRKLFSLPCKESDISFTDYRQLRKIVLE